MNRMFQGASHRASLCALTLDKDFSLRTQEHFNCLQDHVKNTRIRTWSTYTCAKFSVFRNAMMDTIAMS